jgi:PAS domain S-box-containing protein
VSTPRRFHSLLSRVAIGILGLVVLLVGWQIFWEQRLELREVEQAAVARVSHEMELLQTSLDFALAAEAPEQVDRELTARGADPDVETLVLVEETDRVIGSRLRHQVGLPLAEALDDAPPTEMLLDARLHRVGSVRLSEDGRAITATFPVVLGPEPGEIRADRVGVVVARFSLDGDNQAVRARLWRRAIALVSVALVGAAALIVSGQVLIGRRVRTLVAATDRFSAGDLDSRAGVGGTDELAVVGEAFDMMAARVGETQRRLAESEASYRALVELAPVAIFRTDATGRVIDSNSAWRELAGGKPWPDVLHPESREGVLREWAEAAAAGRAACAECRLERPGNGVPWVLLRGVPERGGFINTAVDLTERRQAEETRRQLEARLQQARQLEALGTLASGVAHDFNNVLSAVLGYAEILLHLVAGRPAEERHVQQLLRASERGRRLVQEILAFGRTVPQQLSEVAVAGFLDEVARFLAPSLPENVVLRLDVEAGLPPIRVDPDQLHRVLVNLATNAWQAMRPHGGQLEIGVRAVVVDDEQARLVPELPRGPALLLWVRDEGSGMDAATSARIFEPFFSTKPVGEGTGLGLAVVHSIVRSHGGGILVESELGKGTTFSVFLPMRSIRAHVAAPEVAPPEAAPPEAAPPEAAPPEAAPPEAAPPEAARATTTPPARILYVDDDDDLLELAELAFRRRGYRVTSTSRPRAALELFREAPTTFDLIVTDQHMPVMLGEDLLTAILRIRPDAQVVVLSGHVTPDEARRLRGLGARAVVEKPLHVDEIVRLCGKLLAERRDTVLA